MRKDEMLAALRRRYGCPGVEFDEQITGPPQVLRRLDVEELKQRGWFPRTVTDGRATVIACAPGAALAMEIGKTLGVASVDFEVALAADLLRIIEHNLDLNPGFPPPAGRTPLARVRTFLAGRRSLYAHYRTLLAKSRTGLAFIRTGISAITIALLFARILGAGYLLLLEIPLLIIGLIMAYDGLKWYLPARKIHADLPSCTATEPTGGTSILEARQQEEGPIFYRTEPVVEAAGLRSRWSSLSPVMRRRFLASDRTDLAEERTLLACYRTRMAKARTGLSFARTGIAFISLGLGLIRHFHPSKWLLLDLGLIGIGAMMSLEGLLWYVGGRAAGVEGFTSAQQGDRTTSIWDFFFPHPHAMPDWEKRPTPLPVRSSHLPGIWATTGLALERTVLAERRNVMARLRTVMARARTGLAFIRTGLSVFLIGIVFAVSFTSGGFGWTIFEFFMVAAGLFLIVDGFIWSVPAERIRKEFPYCYGELEIVLPDYGTAGRFWKKAVFNQTEK